MKKVIIILALLTVGCTTSQPEPNFENLLYEDALRNLAYKSINIEDLKSKDFNAR
jgi:hypothetical protein